MRRSGPLVLALTAWIGLILGHVVAYALAYPWGTARHAHLLLTGHGWMGPALFSLSAAAPIVLAAAAARAARLRAFALRPAAVRLAAAQVTAFLLIEVTERHANLADALSDPAVVAGLAVQALVAVAMAALLTLFTRIVAVAVRRRSPVPRARPSSEPPPAASGPLRPDLLGPVRRRAPPVLVGG